MAKRKARQKPAPRDGRRHQGSWRPDYVDGIKTGEAAKAGSTDLLPLCVKSPAYVETTVVVHGPVMPDVTYRVMDVDEWRYMPASTPSQPNGYRIKVQPVRSKVWYSRHTQELVASARERHTAKRGEYLGRSKSFHDGVRKMLDPDGEMLGQQKRLLIQACMLECERRGVDVKRFMANGGTWETLRDALELDTVDVPLLKARTEKFWKRVDKVTAR